MADLEKSSGVPEQRISTVDELKANINSAINDSRLTVEEASEVKYNLDSAYDNIRTETFKGLQAEIGVFAKKGINVTSGGGSERAIGNYLGVDLPSIVNLLRQDGYNIPEQYSVRDNGKYLVFHDASGKDIATMNWETRELGGGGVFVGNDDTSDNYTDITLELYGEVKKGNEIEEKMAEVQKMRENLFDANIIFDDPFDYNSIQLASESFGLSENEFKDMIMAFQKQVVLDGYAPHQEDLWKNIGLFERGNNELWFNQQTGTGQYVGVYDRNGNFQRGGIM